jgi:hypothetical protein
VAAITDITGQPHSVIAKDITTSDLTSPVQGKTTHNDPIPELWVQSLPKEYEKDPYFGPVLQFLKGKSDVGGRVRKHARYLSLDDQGILRSTSLLGELRLAIPAGKIRDTILHGLHEQLGHPGASLLQDTIAQRFFIPGLSKLSTTVTESCMKCIESKPLRRAFGFDAAHTAPTYPFSHISWDLATGMPLAGDHNAVMVILDELTGFVLYEPAWEALTSKQAIQILKNRVLGMFGTPQILRCDQQTAFMSGEFTQFLQSKGIQRKEALAGHHVASVERQIGRLREYIRAETDSRGRGWVERLSEFQAAANNSRSSTGQKQSPFQKLMGYQLPLPLLQNPSLRQQRTDLQEDRAQGWYRTSLQSLVDDFNDRRAEVAEQHDHGRLQSALQVGSFVAVPLQKSGLPMALFGDKISEKARPLFVGPGRITRISEGDNYTIRFSDEFTDTYHVSMLKPLPSEVINILPTHTVPEVLRWPSGKAKICFVSRCRERFRRKEYFVLYWGKHEVDGRWIKRKDFEQGDLIHLQDFELRELNDLPSMLPSKWVVDLSSIPQ